MEVKMNKAIKVILIFLICLGLLMGIAFFVLFPSSKELGVPPNVNRITVEFMNEIYELDERKSQEVCSYFESLPIVKASKTTQPTFTNGAIFSFYENDNYLGYFYIYDMHTIIVREGDSLMKYLTEDDLIAYYNELISSVR